MLTIIRHPELYAAPSNAFYRYLREFWSEPGKGEGVVCLFPTQPLLEEWEKEILAAYGSFGGGHFLLFDGLVRQIWEETRSNWGQISGITAELILRRVFQSLKEEGKIPYHAGASDSPGFFSALRTEITSLKQGGITAKQFTAWAEDESGYGRQCQSNREFSLIYTEYQRFLTENQLADAEDRLALSAMDQASSLWVKGLRRVFAIGFFDFTTGQEIFLTELAKTIPVTILFDTSAAERSSVFVPVFRMEKKTEEAPEVMRMEGPKQKNESNLAFLKEQLWREEIPTQSPLPDETVRLLAVEGGRRRELKAVALEIRSLLEKDPSLLPEEIGVIMQKGFIREEEVIQIFKDTGLPVTGRIRREIRRQPAARALQRLFSAALDPCWSEMIELLRWTGLLPKEALYTRAPGDLEEWKRWLQELHPEDFPGFIFDYLEGIPSEASLASYLEIGERWLNEPGILKNFLPLAKSARGWSMVRHRETAVIAKIREILASLAETSSLLGEWKLKLEEFLSLLDSTLAGVTYTLPSAWESGIRIFSPQEARGLRFRVTLIIGVNEGVFPAIPRSGWALGEEERLEWRLKTVAEELALERLAFYNALRSAEENLILSYCQTDEEGKTVNPGTFLEDLRSLLPEIPIKRLGREFDPKYSVLPPYAEGDREVLSKVRVERGRGKGEPSFNGYLGEGERPILREGFSRPISITALENYAACPFAFYCQRILRIEDRQEPDPLPDRREEGAIYHQILRDFFSRKEKALTSDRLSSYLEEINRLVETHYPGPPENASLGRGYLYHLNREGMKIILGRLVREEIAWQEKTGGNYLPSYLELSFGYWSAEGDRNSTADSLCLEGEDLSLRLRGKIDRVDTGVDGSFIIYDYKLGSAVKAGETRAGKLLQLPLYLLAVQELVAGAGKPLGMVYYSLTRADRKDGFWRPEFVERFNLRLSATKEEEWEELLSESREKAISYYTGIITGRFPLLPLEEKCPSYCPYRWVCRRAVSGGVNNDHPIE